MIGFAFNKKCVVEVGCAAVVAICAFMFWQMIYPYHLHFQEQYSLFQFSQSYFTRLISVPGGFADYIGSFIIQFFYLNIIGALIIALTLCNVYLLIYRILYNVYCNQNVALALALFPTAALWSLLCNADVIYTVCIAIYGSLAALRIYLLVEYKTALRRSFMIITVPLLYWLLGGVSVLFLIGVGVLILFRSKSVFNECWREFLCVVAIWFFCPILAQYVTSYPLSSLFSGIFYYREPEIQPVALNIFYAVIAMVLLLAVVFNRLNISVVKQTVLQYAVLAFAILFGAISISTATENDKEEIMAYDYWVRTHQWNKIIEYANHNTPKTKMTSACVNLALAKNQKLVDQFFKYSPTNDIENLIPADCRNYIEPLYAGEINYQLGYVNNAQRYAFEAMEAIPDGRKSARCCRRLAETNLINGNYAVAAKYIHILQKTIFYRKWANSQAAYLWNDDIVDNDLEYGRIRQFEPKTQYLSGFISAKQRLALSLKENSNNRKALNYMLCICLMQRDLNALVACLQRYGSDVEWAYTKVQEALLYHWIVNHKGSMANIPWAIDKNIVANFTVFVSNIEKYNLDKSKFDSFKETYWYYLIF